jgi:hypothetical protein
MPSSVSELKIASSGRSLGIYQYASREAAPKAEILGRRTLDLPAIIVTSDAIRWHRECIARRWKSYGNTPVAQEIVL